MLSSSSHFFRGILIKDWLFVYYIYFHFLVHYVAKLQTANNVFYFTSQKKCILIYFTLKDKHSLQHVYFQFEILKMHLVSKESIRGSQ